jgi:hypothetical protein
MKRLLLLAIVFASATGCKQPDPPAITERFVDDFNRDQIGANYLATADVYRIKDGALNVSNGFNHPLWLRKKLPRDAVIELDVMSNSPAGDIKIEAWGDGESFATDKVGAYTSSGYDFIHGGWNNSKSILTRMEEHGHNLNERVEPKVVVGKKYHWKIVKKGGHIEWFVDDMSTPFLTFDDPKPLEGPGHEYLGFDDWQSDLTFDNLSITPL